MPPFPGRTIHFGPFNVTSQVFHTTAHSFAVVNLKPLLPGHVLVCSLAVKPRLSDLTHEETVDLFSTVRRVQQTLARLYRADGFNVAVQDGEAAGQSVPHVHCHVIPRQKDDAGGDDKVHRWLEGEEGNIGRIQRQAAEEADRFNGVGLGERKVGKWSHDEERVERTMEIMEQEARWLHDEMANDEPKL
ncbi:HIT-like protein [Piedraia hortae CBS 480.64]|uniref:Bis(5'-adenosyl)-triphosphatase n=1 Tax=Piedraia hortae CBS 480.64 TaxID=1314780 RepID=A0A6A7CC04_9PEZI|nr:HIT-like protein [Piedraia hortae CBS 480.64]